MFTIPKEMIDSVLKNLNPTTRQRHPSQSKGDVNIYVLLVVDLSKKSWDKLHVHNP